MTVTLLSVMRLRPPLLAFLGADGVGDPGTRRWNGGRSRDSGFSGNLRVARIAPEHPKRALDPRSAPVIVDLRSAVDVTLRFESLSGA
jgi:hypothetical protein